MIQPASRPTKSGSRPSTAPAGQRGGFVLRPEIPEYKGAQYSETSPTAVSLPKMGQETPVGSFDIQYRDPWKKTSAFQPASSYCQDQPPPPSPPSWLVSHQAALHHKTARKEDTAAKHERELLGVPSSQSGGKYAPSSYSMSSASPTSVPSWTPMVALPSPDVSILQTPSRNFLDLEPSPASSSYTFDSQAAKKGGEKPAVFHQPTLLLTPGQISMRDPWARSKEGAERSTGSNNAAGGFKLRRDDSSQYSASPASPSKSPYDNNKPRSRRPSRKAVPKIDEEESLASRPDNQNDRANQIYTGCRPFQRASVDEQLADITNFKNPFLARTSLADGSDILTARNLAGRNFSTSTSESMRNPPPHLPRPSFPTFETTYSIRRPSYASEMSNQSFPSKPTRFEFSRRPTLGQPEGIRVSFDSGIML